MKKIVFKTTYDSLVTLIFILTGIMFISACKKNGGVNGPLVSQLKVKIGYDAPQHIDFTYDNLKRVTKIFVYKGDSGSVVSSNDSLILMQFYYEGSSMLPSRSQNKAQWLSTETHYPLYNNRGQIVYDSISHGGSSINFYSYSGDNVTITNKENGVPRGGTFVMEFQNSNLVHTSNVPPLYLSINDYFYYDDMPNPLYNLNISKVFYALALNLCTPGRSIWSAWYPFNKNNTIRQDQSSNGGTPRPVGYFTYVYNSSGLPESRILTNGSSIDTLIYKY